MLVQQVQHAPRPGPRRRVRHRHGPPRGEQRQPRSVHRGHDPLGQLEQPGQPGEAAELVDAPAAQLVQVPGGDLHRRGGLGGRLPAVGDRLGRDEADRRGHRLGAHVAERPGSRRHVVGPAGQPQQPRAAQRLRRLGERTDEGGESRSWRWRRPVRGSRARFCSP